jgi:hypothetical protein
LAELNRNEMHLNAKGDTNNTEILQRGVSLWRPLRRPEALAKIMGLMPPNLFFLITQIDMNSENINSSAPVLWRICCVRPVVRK